MKDMVARLDDPKPTIMPVEANGQWFWLEDGRVLRGREPYDVGAGCLLDPRQLAGDRAFLTWISPAPDGNLLAAGLCTDGSEQNSIVLVDIASASLLSDGPTQRLMDSWTGGAQWLNDSSGFFFSAIEGEAADFAQEVYFHARQPFTSTRRQDIPWVEGRHYRAVGTYSGSPWCIAHQGLTNPIPVAICRPSAGELIWQPFVTNLDGMLAGQAIGNTLVAVTDIDAPRGRLVTVSLEAEHAERPENWREILPESEAVLRNVSVFDDRLVLSELRDTYAGIRLLDIDGRAKKDIELPSNGALAEGIYPFINLFSRRGGTHFVFGFSSLVLSWSVWSLDTSSGDVGCLRAQKVSISGACVEDRWARSKDGTRIPYHVVRAGKQGPRPALLFAYGGYNRALVPEWPGAMAAMVAAGGIFVHAHIRGGSELGRDWWLNGRSVFKQNCYDDLYAVAEDLIANAITTADSLAMTGNSNGGLVAGVAVTQRPDLWAAVIPKVPNLDLIAGFERSYLKANTEHGNPSDSEDARRIATTSPYHSVRGEVDYPAVLVVAGDIDPRCQPWHARKFVAAMQNRSTGSNPHLLLAFEGVGHGTAQDAESRIGQDAEWIAFATAMTGMHFPREGQLDEECIVLKHISR